MCFIQIGFEKTESGKVFYQKFLSEYDAIAYLNDHLHDGDKVYVSGTLKYSVYNGTTQVKKAMSINNRRTVSIKTAHHLCVFVPRGRTTFNTEIYSAILPTTGRNLIHLKCVIFQMNLAKQIEF